MRHGMELCWRLWGWLSLACMLALMPPVCLAARQAAPLYPFILPALLAGLWGMVCLTLGGRRVQQLKLRESAYFMLGSWVVLGIFGALPYWLGGVTTNFLCALFESLAALTTTGVSCLPALPTDPAFVLWHSLLCWLGGLNFIVILVTALPQVSGCFGLTLSARQSIFFSPVWHKMEESIGQATRVYLVLTALAVGLFALAGLDGFMAVTQALMGVASAGSAGEILFLRQDSLYLELAASAVMLLASLNLLLCWKAWQRRSLRLIGGDMELRTFLLVLGGAGLLIAGSLWHQGYYDLPESLRYGFFQALSFLSTSGYVSADTVSWPPFVRYLLFLLVFIGGCIGSTTGGLKVMRLLVLLRMMTAELRRTLHPQLVISLKIDGLPVSMHIVGRILSFFFLYMLFFMVFALLLTLSGITLMQAMGVAAGCLSSSGSTAVLFAAPAFASLPGWALGLCALLMVLGRIEIFAFLLLLDMGLSKLRHQ